MRAALASHKTPQTLRLSVSCRSQPRDGESSGLFRGHDEQATRLRCLSTFRRSSSLSFRGQRGTCFGGLEVLGLIALCGGQKKFSMRMNAVTSRNSKVKGVRVIRSDLTAALWHMGHHHNQYMKTLYERGLVLGHGSNPPVMHEQ